MDTRIVESGESSWAVDCIAPVLAAVVDDGIVAQEFAEGVV